MSHKFNYLFLGLALLFLSSCGDKSKIKVKNRNFSDEVELQQNLIFTFSSDLAVDSMLDYWEEQPYIRFTPEVKGKFKWIGKDELLFSPDTRFAPSTNYQAELTDALLKTAQGKPKFGEETVFKFHTPYLNLQDAGSFWARKEENKNIPEVRFDLVFNYKVNPAEVKNLLHVNVNGKDRNFEMNSSMISEVVQVAMQEDGENYNNKPVKITLAKGLKTVESDYSTTEPIAFETKIPSKDDFQITQADAMYEEEKGYIRIATNQEVTPNISEFIKTDPKVNIKTELLESGFLIKGDFKAGEAYTLTIDENLKGIFGGKLKEDFVQTLVFGSQEPYISFTSKKGIYLTSKGQKNIGIKIINVPKVKVTIIKIYENNILAFLKESGSFYAYEDYYDYDYDYYSNSNYEELGDIVMEKEYNTNEFKKSNGLAMINLDFDDINANNGIYVVRVNSTESQWVKSTKTVSISDIGMIVKETENDVFVFANSILTAKGMNDVEVSLVSSNNQVMQKVKTDKDGVAKFEGLKSKAPGFRLKMVTARSDADFNYLHFNQAMVETSRFDVGGTRKNASGYQAFIYGDREIYRPGEKIYLNTIVRNESWEPLTESPIKLKLILPNGKEFTTLKGTLNKQGAYETSVQLPISSVTGTYNVEVYTANDILLNAQPISVEEFIPDRIKVTATLNKPDFKLSDEVNVVATAVNLFGPPASNRNYEMEFSLQRKNFYVKGFEGYNFQLEGSNNINFENNIKTGVTDEEGLAKETFEFPGTMNDIGLLDGKVFITVFDESGRPVHQVKSFDVLTQEIFFGMKSIDNYVDARQTQLFPLVAVSKAGKVFTSATAKVKVIKHEWQTVLEKTYNGVRYVSQRKQKNIEEKTIQVKGSNTGYTFKPIESGEYEIRVGKPGVDSYVSQYFYAYGWGSTQNSSFEVSKEGNIEIETDKEKYEVGDKANLLFKTPFAGRMLVTVERNNVYDYFYVDTDKKSASVTIPIREEYLPNAYITATLIKPTDDGSIPLTVAHGFLPLYAEKKSNKLPVEIVAEKLSRSRTKQNICIKSKSESDIEVTLAIVDEGILQLKNSKTPDPYGFFFQKKALEVNAYDLYPNLLPELKMGTSSMAGDGYDLDKRVNPLTNKRVKLVAFWSGILRTNSSGEACYSVDVPQFSGDLRIMAVAYKGSSFGSASANMKVADPVVVSTSLPRFLSPGDTAMVPVTMTNTTAKPANAVAKINVSGAVTVDGQQQMNISMKPNSETQVMFRIVAKQAIGTAKITTVVSAMNENFSEEIDITVRPITSLLKKSGAGMIDANRSEKLDLSNGFIPSTVDAKLVVSKSPMVQFSDKLESLLGYPYGCVEQTVSKAFPQLYFSEIVKSLNYKVKSTSDPNANVQEAIRKLQAMQLFNGGLSYWEGGYEESWWGTIYAAHFLAEARKAGFEVNTQMLDKIYGYLGEKVKERNTYDYYYYDGSDRINVKNIAAKEIAYSLFVLAAAGEQDISAMNYYKSNVSLLAIDSRYILACTYLMVGDNITYRTLLPAGFEGERSRNAFGGSFYSYTRDMAISLNALIETDPKHPQIGTLAKHLSQQLKTQRYLSTQENAFALLALGKLAKKANESNITAEVKAGGKKVGDYKDGNLIISKNIAGKELVITTKGTGALYYFWEVEGLSEEGKFTEEDSYLRVRKSFYDRKGREISTSNIRQNDLVVVKITVSSTDNSTVDNVVITDMLPAGFEIENPRLNESADMPWIKNNSVPEHFDIRDDRINLFVEVTPETKTFYYMVRAVSKGTFVMGPVSADAMYNGEYHSYNGAGKITIRGNEVKKIEQ